MNKIQRFYLEKGHVLVECNEEYMLRELLADSQKISLDANARGGSYMSQDNSTKGYDYVVEAKLQEKYPWRKNRSVVDNLVEAKLREKYPWRNKNRAAIRLDDIDFDDGELDFEDIDLPGKSDDDEGVIESIITAPFKAIRGIGDFLLVDQELEGRKAGSCVASKRFIPIFKKIKERGEKLKIYHTHFRNDCDIQMEISKKYFYRYKKDNDILTRKINELKSEKNSKEIDNLLRNAGFVASASRIGGSGAIGAAGVGSTATSGGVGLTGLATPLAAVSIFVLFGGFLDRYNQEKYNKYFTIAYREIAAEYQRKFDREMNEQEKIIEEIIVQMKRVSRLSEGADEEFQKNVKLKALKEEIQKFVELNVIYATVKGM